MNFSVRAVNVVISPSAMPQPLLAAGAQAARDGEVRAGTASFPARCQAYKGAGREGAGAGDSCGGGGDTALRVMLPGVGGLVVVCSSAAGPGAF